MSLRTVLALYNLALPPALLAALPGSLLKMVRRGGYGRDLAQRFGLYRQEVQAALAALDKPCWVHAVSVGEVLVAAKFIAALRRRHPGIPVVLSTTTTTGHALARSEIPPDVPVLFNPLDLPGCVRRALETIRPRRLVLVEAEVWPNLVHTASRWGIPVALINARLSPRSERRYRAVRSLVAPVFGSLDHVLVPEPDDVARWTAIGVRPEVIAVTGSLKHDYTGLPDDPRSAGFASLLGEIWGRPAPAILLAASTHPGEEAALAKVFLALRDDFPRLKCLIVPRHVERTAAVVAELRTLGLAVARRSTLESPTPGGDLSAHHSIDAVVIDTTGELRAWQPLADVVVVGKSFLATGGQNPVEALMAGRPVVVGPHMENFAALIRSLIDHQAVIQVPGLDALTSSLRELLRSPEHGHAMVRRAREALAVHQHSAERTVDSLFPGGQGSPSEASS